MKKGVKKVIKIVIIVLVISLLVGIGYLAYKRFFAKDNTPKKVEVVEKVDEYGYTLDKSDTKLFTRVFKEMTKILNKETVDEEQYARYVAMLTVADFYNLNNKVSKNDIGGVQFVKSDYRSNFSLEASETVYKYIEHNIYGNRTQKLPVVSNVEIKTMEATTYKYGSIDDQKAYKGIVTVTYEEDLGYPTEVTVVMIHTDKKLEVIKMY